MGTLNISMGAPGKKRSAPKKVEPAPMPMDTMPEPPTPQERTHDHARDAKVRATQDWVEGRITSKQHANVHKRANHVLMKKDPAKFKGTTGEKAMKGKMPW
jgi:hypothetical protein